MTNSEMDSDSLKPNVSVVIPTFNRLHLLKQSIDSALVQTHKPMEVIVIDDGSSDETPRWLQNHSRENPIIKAILFDENQGAQCARVAGMKAARGDFICFLDSDDVLIENAIEVRLEAIKKFGFKRCLVYGDRFDKREDRYEFVGHEKLVGYSFERVLRDLSLCPFSIF